MKTLRFRNVSLDDTEKLLDIYAPYVEKTIVSFECEVPGIEEFRERIASFSKDYPYFVCELDGEIIGYAYAHRHMERAAYQWNAELSIYIKDEYTHMGIGKILCITLIELLKLQGVRNVYSCLAIPNEKSEQLQHSLGFEMIGVFRKTGYKLGAWRDMAWFGKNIAPLVNGIAPVSSIRSVPKEKIARILEKGAAEATARLNKHLN